MPKGQRRGVLWLGLLLAMPTASSPGGTATGKIAGSRMDRTANAEQVSNDVRQTAAALNAREAEAAVRSNAPDFIQMFHGQPNADNTLNLANARPQVAETALKLAIEDQQTTDSEAGGMAVSSNRYTYTFTALVSNSPRTETGKLGAGLSPSSGWFDEDISGGHFRSASG